MTDVLDILIGMPNVLADEDQPLPYQPPNLKDRLAHAIRQARAATSEMDRREWLVEAQNLLERLVDASLVCHCGMTLNQFTARCPECDENERQMAAQRESCGRRALDIDPIIGF